MMLSEVKKAGFPEATSPTFSEAIKVRDGEFYNLIGHRARMDRTVRHFFGKTFPLGLTPEMIPTDLRTGLVKCRVVYGAAGIESVGFSSYSFREIKTVAIIRDDTIEYEYKSTDRSHLNRLLVASGCDEIIIVKNGFVTDASAANIVLEDASGALYTPSTCLLPGTKRASLLERGVVVEREVRENDLRNAEKIYLVNAMIEIEDNRTLRSCLNFPAAVICGSRRADF